MTQDVIINPDIKYAFAVKAVNVQGASDFSLEKIKELKASENKAKDKDAVPRVIIVAIVLGSILFVIIKLMIITCCIKQRKENRRREEKKLERSSSLSSKRSMMIDRYPGSKYSESFPGDMFVSPPSHSGSALSLAHDHPDYKVCQYHVGIAHHSLITEAIFCSDRSSRNANVCLSVRHKFV